MHEATFANIVATMAKEIVVSKMSSSTAIANAESGRKVAEFYDEIYKGIFETLKSDFIDK